MKKGKNTILQNKKATFEYEIMETFVAGVQLEGWMVKSIRANRISASDGVYAKIINGEVFLIGLHIKPLESKNTFSKTDDQPTLKLLLNKKEISKLIGAEKEKGQTLILKNLFWQKHLVKATICLAKGKKMHDKRQDLKKKQMERETQRALKSY
jgi:SsrA-binding protein